MKKYFLIPLLAPLIAGIVLVATHDAQVKAQIEKQKKEQLAKYNTMRVKTHTVLLKCARIRREIEEHLREGLTPEHRQQHEQQLDTLDEVERDAKENLRKIDLLEEEFLRGLDNDHLT